MSIASGFHADPPSGKFSTTSGQSNTYLETRVSGGDLDETTSLWTEHDVIRIPTGELLLTADLLVRHHKAITEEGFTA